MCRHTGNSSTDSLVPNSKYDCVNPAYSAEDRPGRQSQSCKSSAEKRLWAEAEPNFSWSRKMFEPAKPSRKNFEVI